MGRGRFSALERKQCGSNRGDGEPAISSVDGNRQRAKNHDIVKNEKIWKQNERKSKRTRKARTREIFVSAYVPRSIDKNG